MVQAVLAAVPRVGLRLVSRVLGVARATAAYVSRPRARDARLMPLLRMLAGKLPWCGYRGMWDVVNAAVEPIGRNGVHRLWQMLHLQRQPLKRRRRIRRRLPTVPGLRATGPNQVWCLDFMKDYTADRRVLRFLSVVDEYTRECLAFEVGRRFRAEDVLDVLETTMQANGTPANVRSDNGPEFVAGVVERWGEGHGIRLVRSAPGCPWHNPFSETFHSRARWEFMEREEFGSEEEGRLFAEVYRRWYNEARPHGSLGRVPPAVFAGKMERPSSLFRDLVRMGYATS
jgi:putative transposase